MTGFIEYFKVKIKVSSMIAADKVDRGDYDEFDIFINMSDHFNSAAMQNLFLKQKQSFWFPCGEFQGISLSSLYGALKVLDTAYKEDKKVLLYCMSGVNRSKTVYDAFYFAKTNTHLPDNFIGLGEWFSSSINMLLYNINNNYLPRYTEKFIQRIFFLGTEGIDDCIRFSK
jgi:hypothetical protein